jgi:hypothetical protein
MEYLKDKKKKNQTIELVKSWQHVIQMDAVGERVPQ